MDPVLASVRPSLSGSTLDMEAAAALQVATADPGLRVAMPWRSAATGDPGPARPGDEPSTLRARSIDGETRHWVRREVLSQLAGRTTFFSTFGGNPVSAAAALAVLDVIEDEHLVERVDRTGEHPATVYGW